MIWMASKSDYICIHEDTVQDHEAKLSRLEARSNFKDEKIEQILEDNKRINKKLDKINENIHQLQLKSARDDFNIDNRVTQLETTVRVLKWISVFLVSVVVMAISLATFILTHSM